MTAHKTPVTAVVKMVALLGATLWFQAADAGSLDSTPNPYKFVLTSYTGVSIGTVDVNGGSRFGTVLIDGRVWQNAPDSAFKAYLSDPSKTTVQIGGVPALNAEIADFIASHAAGAAAPTFVAGNPAVLQFYGPSPNVNYFVSDNPLGSNPTGSNTGFSLRLWSEVSISVRDTVVWVLPHGVRFENLVSVSSPGGAPACLIIVANPNGTYIEAFSDFRDVAIWCFGSMRATSSVAVILAAGGEARIEAFNNSTTFTDIPYLSVYALDVYLMGPLGNLMRFHHLPPYDNDLLIDRLTAQGALPMPASGPTAVEHGTWGRLKLLYKDGAHSGSN
jgi:hypothetical protein